MEDRENLPGKMNISVSTPLRVGQEKVSTSIAKWPKQLKQILREVILKPGEPH